MTGPSDAPPSYDSLFGKIKKAKDESSGNVDFAMKTIGMILCGTGNAFINIHDSVWYS